MTSHLGFLTFYSIFARITILKTFVVHLGKLGCGFRVPMPVWHKMEILPFKLDFFALVTDICIIWKYSECCLKILGCRKRGLSSKEDSTKSTIGDFCFRKIINFHLHSVLRCNLSSIKCFRNSWFFKDDIDTAYFQKLILWF